MTLPTPARSVAASSSSRVARTATVRTLARSILYFLVGSEGATELFGDRTELMFASHHWPRWGTDNVREFLCRQRDLYRWIHDQTLRLANHGFVATEIAEMLQPAAEHYEESHTIGYYGSLIHNVKAVYQRYLSWYDGNPCHLHARPTRQATTAGWPSW